MWKCIVERYNFYTAIRHSVAQSKMGRGSNPGCLLSEQIGGPLSGWAQTPPRDLAIEATWNEQSNKARCTIPAGLAGHTTNLPLHGACVRVCADCFES